MAAFAEVLALLVEQQTPLDEALRLAADASGDESLRVAAGRVAAAVARGEPAARPFTARPSCR